MKPLLNQIHVDYVLSDFAGDRNRFAYLFALLDGIDPFERRWFMPDRLGDEASLDLGHFVEERLDQQFVRFKHRLVGLLESDLRECSIVFMYVSETLNMLRRLGCPVETRKRALRLSETLHALEGIHSPLLSSATRDSVLAKLQEMLANSTANGELFKGRYELFCNRIAAKLVGERFSEQLGNAS